MAKRNQPNGKRVTGGVRSATRGGERAPARRIPAKRRKPNATLLGRFIVTDPKICHGKPTFRGTRIMVWQVLEMVAEGMAWESIVEEWEGSISRDAVEEAVRMAYKSFLKHSHEYALEPLPA